MLDRAKFETTETASRTRRNLLAMGGILAATMLAGCKHDVVVYERRHWQKPAKPSSEQTKEPNCFLKGTPILTPAGEKAIDTLKVGDEVKTQNGETKQIKWIGVRCFNNIQALKWDTMGPIRITRDSLGPNVPHIDILVSPNHRFLINGILVRAVDLVDDFSIVHESADLFDRLEYFHLLLEAHDIVLAGGAPAETLLFDPFALLAFDNPPDFLCGQNPSSLKTENTCAPVFDQGGRRARLASHLRSAVSPWIDYRTDFDKFRDRWIAR